MKLLPALTALMKQNAKSRGLWIRTISLWGGLALSVLLVLLGSSGPRLNDAWPAYWSLVIRWPGMDARSIEERVALSLEEGLADMDGVKDGRFTCTAGELRARLFLADLAAADRVRLFIDALHARLPSEVPRPLFTATDPDDQAFWLAAVSGGDGQLPYSLRDELLALDGVASCELSGVGEDELLVVPEEERVRDAHLSLEFLCSALRAPGRALHAGSSGGMGEEIPLLLSYGASTGIVGSGDINIPLEGHSGHGVADLGEVLWVRREPSSRSYLDGEPLVMLSVRATAGTDKRRLSRLVADLFEGFRMKHPDVRLEVLEDEGARLEASWKELLMAAVISLLLVFASTLLICRQRSAGNGGLSLALLCAFCVPLVIFFAVILLLFAGQHLDRTLLTALAISSGFTIDAFLVVIEMIFDDRVERQGRNDLGPSLLRVMERVLLSSSGTTLIALVPLCLATSADLALVGKTLFATTLVSFFVARFFLVPCIKALSQKDCATVNVVTIKRTRSRAWHRLLAGFASFMDRYRYRHLALWTVLVLASLACIPVALDKRTGQESPLIPFSISFEAGTGRAARARRLEVFSAALRSQLDGKVTVWALLSGDQARGSVRRDARNITSKAVIEALRAQTVEGGSVHAGYGSLDEHWWELCVYSHRSEDAREVARCLAPALESTGTVLHFRPGDPQLTLSPIRPAAALSGFDIASLSGALRRMLEGLVVGKVPGPSGEHDVRLSSAEREDAFNPGALASLAALKTACLSLGEGRSFPVASLFSFGESVGPVSLERESRQALARLSFSSSSSSMAAARRIFDRAMEGMDIPAQTRVVFDPEACAEAAQTRRLVALIFVAALFCVLFLGCIDNSVRGPILCLFSLLPALAATFPVLLSCSLGAGPPALCAAILLSGIGINASILCLEQLGGRVSSAASLYYLWRKRLPIVMTTSLTSVFSCIPFALLPGPAAAMARELSIVCIAGILIAAASSLLFLPLLRGLALFHPRTNAPVPATRRPVCGGQNP